MKLARGSRSEWTWLGATVLAAALLLGFGRGGSDASVEVETTLTPLDAGALACAGDGCAYDAAGAPAPVASPLRPFVTTAGQLVALSGVFESEQVKAWAASATDGNQRMRVRCEAKWLSKQAQLAVRFRAQDAFGPPAAVPALAASDCQLIR